MMGEIALRHFHEAKGREKILITTWCCWRVNNLTVFDGFEGLDEESIHLVSRLVADMLQNQVEEIHTHTIAFLEKEVADRVFQRLRGWL